MSGRLDLTMPVDWRAAYLRQAHSDFNAFQFLASHVAAGALPKCHSLHYLQMTLEKLGKGIRTPTGGPEPAHEHSGAVLLLNVLHQGGAAANKHLHQALGFPPPQRKEFLNSLAPTAEKVERLTPARAQDGPNWEYPWQPPGIPDVAFPAEHPFSEPELSAPKIAKLVQFLEKVFASLQSVGELP